MTFVLPRILRRESSVLNHLGPQSCRAASAPVLALAAALAMLLVCAPLPAATPQEVEQAIQKGKAFILAHQDANGSWEVDVQGHSEQIGGPTALVTYGMLATGEDPKSPAMVKAIKYLSGVNIQATYGLGLRSQVWAHLPNDAISHAAIVHDANLLYEGFKDHKPQGFYRYIMKNPPPKGGAGADGYDHSNSQYAVLGFWAAADMNLEVPTEVWTVMDKGWCAHQNADGGWGYVANETSTASMTAAGLASLFIMQDMLHGNDGIGCTGNIVDPNIEKGLAWMSDAFKTGKIDFRDRYLMYGIERIGVASGRRFLGTTDWFAAGADDLVKTQSPDGSWDCHGYGGWGGAPCDTAFCLLFLSTGRAPVMANKLQYSIDTHGDKPVVADWNQRPRDLAHLAKWASKQCETPLNWQVVNLDVPVEDLHDSPILYIAGDQTLSFSKADLDKLRLFIEQGGLIVGNADCDKPAFSASFKKLGQKLAGAYEFALLPESHVIFTGEQFRANKWDRKPRMEALSNGARVLMVLLPGGDPARYWQTSNYSGHHEAYEAMSDIFLYAVDRKGLRAKGDTYIVTADPTVTPSRTIKVARLEYSGNWDPEPGGWRRLAAVMHNKDAAALTVASVKLGAGQLDSSYNVAHLTGTAAFTLTAPAQAELKKYIAGGGTLVIDAAGGSGEFTSSAEKALSQIWPDKTLEFIKSDDPLYSAASDKVNEVSYRTFARQIVGSSKTPRLRALVFDHRPAVLLSGEDLSVGLVGMEIDGIIGYTPLSSTNLMRNILIFAATPHAASGAATRPDASVAVP